MEKMLIKYCAPTLAGIKTGSLVSYEYNSREHSLYELKKLNKRLGSKGVRLIPIKYFDCRMLIYIYRPKQLQTDFTDFKRAELLEKYGYPQPHAEKCIAFLMNKLGSCADFPHEIGLFLGYPPEDVLGFIDNKAKNYKISGLWKVYGNEHNALKKFAQYNKCTELYSIMYKNGAQLEKLAILR